MIRFMPHKNSDKRCHHQSTTGTPSRRQNSPRRSPHANTSRTLTCTKATIPQERLYIPSCLSANSQNTAQLSKKSTTKQFIHLSVPFFLRTANHKPYQKKTPRPESASELYRPSNRRLSANLVPAFAERRCHVVSVTDPFGRILGFSRPAPLLFLYFK
jgi:hypothetical protein